MARLVVALVTSLAVLSTALGGQEPAAGRSLQLSARGPAFFMVPSPGAARLDARDAVVLKRPVTLDLHDAPIATALLAIERSAGVRIIYATDLIPGDLRVTVRADPITLAAALTDILQDVPVDVQIAPDGRSVGLVPRQAPLPRLPLPPAQRTLAASVITGRVTDAKTGERLVNVVVSITGTRIGTSSRVDGSYVLPDVAPGTQTIAFRRLGYVPTARTVTVVADSTAHVDVALAPSPAFLDQVVTTATGDAYALQVGNTVGTIPADSVVAKTGADELSDILSARVPGAQVFAANGLVGVSPQINIRGQNSAQLSNQPLLYIDGVRVSNTTGNDQFDGESGRFNDVLPEEIESIEVIKGPAASALYGTDAANGIILIHTKRGRVGHPQWSLYGETGSTSADKSLFPNNVIGWGHTLGGGPSSVVQCALWQVAEHACAQDSIQSYSPLRDPYWTPLTTGGVNELGAQVSGGGDTRYFVSGGYSEQAGYLKLPYGDSLTLASERGGAGIGSQYLHPNSLIKESVRTNLTTSLGPTADLTVGAGYVSQTDHIPQSGDALEFGFGGAPYRDTSANAASWLFSGTPLQTFALLQSEEAGHFTLSGSPSWRPFSWLRAQATVGIDNANNYIDQLAVPGETFFYPDGYRYNSHNDATGYTATATATATTTPASFLSTITVVGVNYNRAIDHELTGSATTLSSGCTTLACGASPVGVEFNSNEITAGAFAEQTVGVNNRLFAKAGVRVDGGSTFGTDYQAIVYPRGSLSWVVSNEPFVPHVPGLSLLRLRVAAGQTGVQPSPTTRYNVTSTSTVVVNDSTLVGAQLSQLANTRVKPELQTEVETGADAEWFGGRLHVEGTYYWKHSSNALEVVPLPTSLGGFYQQINVGTVRNVGYEGLVTARLVESRLVSWDVSVNGSVNLNEVVKLVPGVTCALTFSPTNCAGLPIASYFQPLVTYADRNHDGIIDTNEVTIGATPQFAGNTYPKNQLTVQQTLSLLGGRVQISAMVDHRGGFTEFEQELLAQGTNTPALYERGSPLRQQAAAIAAMQGGYAGYLVDASFTRMQNVAVTLALPASWAALARCRTASLTVSASNLALWTQYKGGDPEENQATGQPQYGAYLTGSALVPPRTVVVRANLGF